MSSMKASVEGLSLIKQAIAQKGWRIRDDRWLVAASYILEPDGDWRPDGPYAYGCSLQTWERFLQRVAIRDRSFLAFCKVLGLSPIQIADNVFSGEAGLNLGDETKVFFDEKYSEKNYLGEKGCSEALFNDLLSRIVSLEYRLSDVENQLSTASASLSVDSEEGIK